VRDGYLLKLGIIEVGRCVVRRALRIEAPVTVDGEDYSANSDGGSAKALGEKRKSSESYRSSLNKIPSVHGAFPNKICERASVSERTGDCNKSLASTELLRRSESCATQQPGLRVCIGASLDPRCEQHRCVSEVAARNKALTTHRCERAKHLYTWVKMGKTLLEARV
jgi:hypothetical protein